MSKRRIKILRKYYFEYPTMTKWWVIVGRLEQVTLKKALKLTSVNWPLLESKMMQARIRLTAQVEAPNRPPIIMLVSPLLLAVIEVIRSVAPLENERRVAPANTWLMLKIFVNFSIVLERYSSQMCSKSRIMKKRMKIYNFNFVFQSKKQTIFGAENWMTYWENKGENQIIVHIAFIDRHQIKVCKKTTTYFTCLNTSFILFKIKKEIKGALLVFHGNKFNFWYFYIKVAE